ncbi:MAG: hypothetical protein V3U76_07640 [Granulosicoccus sp.]
MDTDDSISRIRGSFVVNDVVVLMHSKLKSTCRLIVVSIASNEKIIASPEASTPLLSAIENASSRAALLSTCVSLTNIIRTPADSDCAIDAAKKSSVVTKGLSCTILCPTQTISPLDETPALNT